ncbi:hypothetical protein ACFZAV_34335 [Streptomyces sp. NPDC008343]|uniref:hypothetical protein n=1 Tax=Streptomyces sp. NPDC008343 TaxID=3364828 RepID=UPI0036E91A08
MSGSLTVRKLAVAVSLLPLLAACGTASHSADGGESSAGGGTSSVGSSEQLDIPADAGADLKKQYLVQNAIAACMKKQGFTYIPIAPMDMDLEDSWADSGADYKLTKKHRQRYGFDIYAGIVYPNDPQAMGSKASQENETDTPNAPNERYVATLTPEQKAAYDTAMGVTDPEAKASGKAQPAGCSKSAAEKVYGSAAAQKRSSDQEAAQQQANTQALNGDPKLVALAQSYASCLKKQGISVTTTQPTEIGHMVRSQALESAPPALRAGDVNPDGTPVEAMSKDEALPLLTRDIDLALQDLECGREFRSAYFPKFFKAPAPVGGGAG